MIFWIGMVICLALAATAGFVSLCLHIYADMPHHFTLNTERYLKIALYCLLTAVLFLIMAALKGLWNLAFI